MLKYILNLRHLSHCMEALSADFGSMYFLYPQEDRHTRGYKNAGFARRVFEKGGKLLRKNDSTRDFMPEKIY
ncbi:MAG: hypothetical protein GXP53_14260 [Deltaproteobacteria bacterium]|nr:hypothetical protein [Deltaproteobacteria bacterium]